MTKKLCLFLTCLSLLGCSSVEDDTLISFQGKALDENGIPLDHVKVELVSTSLRSLSNLEALDLILNDVEPLDVYDITDENGDFQFFFPRSDLNLAIYLNAQQNLNFVLSEVENNFPIYLLDDQNQLEVHIGNVILTSSQ